METTIKLYVIKSDENGNLYGGICKDVQKRLIEHNRGKNRYTKGLRPWKLVHQEEFGDGKRQEIKRNIIRAELVKKT